LLKESEKEATPLQDIITHSEEDPLNQIHGLVPIFATRWRAICKYFINSDKTQPRRTGKMIKMQGEIIHLYSSNKPQD
jgi:hypothetical protein